MATYDRLSRLSKYVRHPRWLIHQERGPEPCGLCQFSPDTPFASRHTIEVWIESAKKGCVYCQMVVLVTRDLNEKHGIDITDDGKDTVCFNGGDYARQAGRCFITASRSNYSGMILLYNAFETQSPLKDLPFDCHVSPSADSDQCLNLVAQWLSECRGHHQDCNNKPPSSWIPTRLIDVGDSAHAIPRLVVREQVPKDSQFIALSHCWGKAQLIRTLNANFAFHCDGIDPTSLPPTFLHAIRLTRSLGYRYIWIDSLCIVQDDKLDWEREAAKMAQVYGDAALVLAATSASSSEEGFLVPRKTYFQGQVEVSDPKSKHNASYLVNYRPLFAHVPRTLAHSADGPLGTRAWTFQERALAKRFVSFGRDELLWECRSLNDCECDYVWLRREKKPEPGRKHPYLKENPDLDWTQLNKLSLEAKVENASPRDLYFEWRQNVVHPYSHRQITYASDKLIALSAIASTFQAKLGSEEQYLAGIWRGDLIRGLAWFCVLPRILSECYFPSWTWASLNGTAVSMPDAPLLGGGVTFTMPMKYFNFETTCSVLDTRCVPMSSVNPFGSVERGASITLKGKLSPATIEFYPRGSDGRKDIGSKAVGASGDTGWEYCVMGMVGMTEKRYNLKTDTLLEEAEIEFKKQYDDMTEKMTTAIRSPHHKGENITSRTEYAQYSAWCFLLGTYRSGETRGAIILVLGRSLTEADNFERLGLLEIDLGYGSADVAFNDWEEEIVTLV